MWKVINFSSIDTLLELYICYYNVLDRWLICFRNIEFKFKINNIEFKFKLLDEHFFWPLMKDILCFVERRIFLFQRNINGNKNFFFFKLCKNYAGMILNFFFFIWLCSVTQGWMGNTGMGEMRERRWVSARKIVYVIKRTWKEKEKGKCKKKG